MHSILMEASAFSGGHHAYIAPKKKKFNKNSELYEIDLTIKTLILSLKQTKLSKLQISSSSETKSLKITKLELKKEELYVYYQARKERYYTISLKTPPVFLSQAIDLDTGTKLEFISKNEYKIFKTIFLRLIELINLRKILISKIIYTNPSHLKKYSMFHHDEIDDIDDIKADIELPYLKKLLKTYHRNYSFYTPLEKSNFSEKDFLNFSDNFISLLNKNPRIIFKVDIVEITDILKKIYLELSHIEMIGTKLKNFFQNHSRDLLIYLRDLSNKNGQKIFRMIEKDSSLFKDADFHSILRTESDLIWIAYLRNMNVQEKYIKKNIINDLYNFEEIILIAHIKILLSLIFFQIKNPKNWKNKIKELLSDEHFQRNYLERKDFSFPYGRWAQAGQILEVYSKENKLQLSQKIKEKILTIFSAESSYKSALKTIINLDINSKKISTIISNSLS